MKGMKTVSKFLGQPSLNLAMPLNQGHSSPSLRNHTQLKVRIFGSMQMAMAFVFDQKKIAN
jgi:hypothetical protein